MEYAALILPTALLAGILLFFFRWFLLMRTQLRAPEAVCAAAPRSRRLHRRDAAIMAAITAVYAFFAFFHLGDTDAPQNYYAFAPEGSAVTVELPDGVELGSILYFTGLNMGKYTLELSFDGEEYVEAGELEQGYTDLFKWYTFRPDTFALTVRGLRLTSSSGTELGELALLDTDGNPVPADALRFDAEAAALFDEQDTVPADGYTYRNSTYFDEIYHARTAYEHIRSMKPYEISHPPLGKLIMSLGIRLFGMTPFGWRFMGTLFGTLMLPILYILLQTLFGSTEISAAGTAIFATDFMHFTQTRIATIDTYAVFFILLMYLFMYRFVSADTASPDFSPRKQKRDLYLSGLFFGLGAASKWTCFYAGAGLAVIWLLYWIFRGVRAHREGTRDFVLDLLENILSCIVCFILIPAVIYYLSYTPYGRAKGLSGVRMYFSGDYLRTVLDNQKYMFSYHSHVTATHPYSSRWYEWMLDIRPILYHREYPTEASKSLIAAFVSPLICWGGLIALGATAWLGIRRKDKKALFLLIGYLAQLLPWVAVTRVTFAYHYFNCVPFLVLCLCYVFDALREIGAPGWKKSLRRFALASVVLFLMFFPVLSGETAFRWYFPLLDWLPRWPL